MNLRLLLNHQEIKRMLSAARWQPFRQCHILITLLDTLVHRLRRFVIRRWINLKRVPGNRIGSRARWKPLYALNRVRGPRRIRDCREFLIQIIGRRPILAFHVPNTNASAGERRSSRSGVKCFHANEVADSGRGKVAGNGWIHFVTCIGRNFNDALKNRSESFDCG